MDLTNITDRKTVGRELKIKYQYLMNQTKQATGVDKFSYTDMKLIADAMNNEVPQLVGLKELPPQVKAALLFATSSLDPNEIRRGEDMKKGLSLCAGVGGAAVVWISLGTLLNPGVWALVVAFFAGGVAGGPLAVLGLGAGIATIVAAVYNGMSKKTPNERITACIEMVEKSIDKWIEDGCKDSISQ